MFHGHVTLEVCISFSEGRNQRTWKCILFSNVNWKPTALACIFVSELKTHCPGSSRPWNRLLFSELKPQGSGSVYFCSELKSQGPGSVNYFRNWTIYALEVYNIFGTGNLTPWKCILWSELKTQRSGRVYYFRTWHIFGTKNSRPGKCLLGSEVKNRGLGSAYYRRNWKLNALQLYSIFWNWTLAALKVYTISETENSTLWKCILLTWNWNLRPWRCILFSELFSELKAQRRGSDHCTCMYDGRSTCIMAERDHVRRN